jgi:RNA polymerase-binding transcription factor DksA
MRRQYHRCRHLRVVTVDASELSGARKGGRVVLEELCDAKRFEPCVGLVDCDILSLAGKRELLLARASHLREQEGPGPISGLPPKQRAAVKELRADLLSEHQRLSEELRKDEGAVTELRLAKVADRLAAIDRALEAMRQGVYGICAACRSPIEVERLRRVPDTRVCTPCASA